MGSRRKDLNIRWNTGGSKGSQVCDEPRANLGFRKTCEMPGPMSNLDVDACHAP